VTCTKDLWLGLELRGLNYITALY